ncbi:hypothetical protein FEM48_Zijuj01G0021900 [Ziziphus jujuba var. spinosa]|uniref:Uncharacterized protein n=1 Tax=Ziziphus jujuba var. spinosa TaxID=714518 RepID=A0A978VYJ0_ZIZJJ|nr:hypothetical protein FEM48_Zijuj01G0021900 [Ziziphus jujuba var. spinosa]
MKFTEVLARPFVGQQELVFNSQSAIAIEERPSYCLTVLKRSVVKLWNHNRCLLLASPTIMDPKHTGDMLKHLEKQNELLMEAYRSMSHELHKLQVEEEMLMRKFYEIMSAHGKISKTEDRRNISDDGSKVGDSTALVTTTNNDEQ